MYRRLLMAALLLGPVVSACSSSASTDTEPLTKAVELNVHVATSMTRVFTELGDAFHSEFPNVTVKFNFAGSSTLATQIQQGAPADIVVMADSANIDKLVASGDVNQQDVTDLARNKMAILVAQGNPSKINSLSDLTRRDLSVVLCDSSQPCGKYADTMLSAANVALSPASREANASAVVARIASGEADAGIAYVTDARASSGKVASVAIPDSQNVVANYPIAPIATPSSGNATTVAEFIAMARGPIGAEILTNEGFILP